jgi:hypothetical protein
MPAYFVGHAPNLGWSVLFRGLLFGWAMSGWAAYANVCFVVAAIYLLRGRQPSISIILMLACAATLPMFDREMAPDYESPVLAWGWGMPVWLSAQVALTSATIARSGRPRAATMILAVSLVVGFGALFATRSSQLRLANEQERDLYLSHGMAFAATKLCEVPFEWPEGPVIPKGARFATDIDPSLRSDPPDLLWLGLPLFRGRVVSDQEWDVFSLPGVFSGEYRVKVTEPARFVLEARKVDGGAVVRIRDRQAHAVLYEQSFREHISIEKSGSRNARKYLCPGGNDDPESRGVKQALARALGLPLRPVDDRTPPELPDEIATEPCPLAYAGQPGRFRWDEREIVLSSEVAQQSAGFCSEKHAFLARLTRGGGTGPGDVPNVLVLDRDTLRPVALFDDRNWCRRNDLSCFDPSSATISGVSLKRGGAILRTRDGDLAAPHGIRLTSERD